MHPSDPETTRDDERTPFFVALDELLRRRGISPESFCAPGDPVARRVLEEYGAMYVASDDVLVPASCILESEDAVLDFQRAATWRSTWFGDTRVELQPAAAEALSRARSEAQREGFDVTPRGGAEAGRRSFADSLRLWRSRCEPALEHWRELGRLTEEQSEAVRNPCLREQVAAVLELEESGIFFSKDFSKSILYSVAAPGASQHLAMLAFDVEEFSDERVRRVLARHGWFQTIRSDLPHFTFLGLPESELPRRGLKKEESGGRTFWVPNVRKNE